MPLTPDRRSRRALPLAATCTLLALGITSSARASQETELQAAETRMASANYADAEARLRRLVDPAGPLCPETPALTENGCQLTDPKMLETARENLVIALVANGKRDEAGKLVDVIYLQNPKFKPEKTLFPDPVMDLFNEEAERLKDEIAKKAQEADAKLAKQRAQEEALKKERDAYISALEARAGLQIEKHSRWIAAVPFGVGQYQNDNVGWGLFFTVSELITVGTAIGAAGGTYNLARQGIGLQNWNGCLPALPGLVTQVCVDPKQVDKSNTPELQALAVVGDVSLGAFVVLAVSGIIEAEASFKPTVETKHPELLPPKPKVLVTGVPNAPSAYGAGLKITF